MPTFYGNTDSNLNYKDEYSSYSSISNELIENNFANDEDIIDFNLRNNSKNNCNQHDCSSTTKIYYAQAKKTNCNQIGLSMPRNKHRLETKSNLKL